jgi:hypothetical protein
MSGNRALHFAFGLIAAISGLAIVPVPGIA